ncbi:MAG: GNAT family N-acetyltransferase [Flavobacteriales bacterium]|nr:GNAT family N-acetyltransferase [Flavobacteriales bacterium]
MVIKKESKLELGFVNEFQIDNATSMEINSLLARCFPETKYEKRDYFKQLPHYRILAKEGKRIIGQLGIDFRIMNLNGKAVRVFGVVDLCVDLKFQGKGIGRNLIGEFESIAKKHSDKIDFLFLVTDKPQFYQTIGFKITNITTTWMKINQHKSYGIGKEKIQDAFFLVKDVSNKQWKDGELDLLGYMY